MLVGVVHDGHKARAETDFGAPATLELDGQPAAYFGGVGEAGRGVGGGQRRDRPSQLLGRLFEALGKADAGAQEGLALEALEALRGERDGCGRGGLRAEERAVERIETELQAQEDVGHAQRAFAGQQAGAPFDGGEEGGGVVAGERVDQVVDERHEHGVVRTVERDRLGGRHQYGLHERPLSKECR